MSARGGSRSGGRGGGGAGDGGRRATAPVRRVKERVRTAKGRPVGSTRWLSRQLNDPLVQEAKRLGYRSRAAFKLLEVNEKTPVLRPGGAVVDLGAAPGGWSQVAAAETASTTTSTSITNRSVVAVDLHAMEPIPGVEILCGDCREDAIQQEIRDLLGRAADMVLSDMGPDTIGHAATDHLRSVALAECAVEFAASCLAPGGGLLVKLFQGAEEQAFVEGLRMQYRRVARVRPRASRTRSPELYILALGFRG